MKPVFLHFITQEYFNKNQENQGATLEKMEHMFRRNLKLKNFEILETLSVHFEFLKFRIPDFLIIKNDEFLKMMKSRRRGIS